ncbi:MAG: hypothetical protein K5656_02050 [Lachnospiraceae bacterium]|nr:hypothetical protein [Lachnospiraceae bacterium]
MNSFKRLIAFLLVFTLAFSFVQTPAPAVNAAKKSNKYLTINKASYSAKQGKTITIKGSLKKKISASKIKLYYYADYLSIKKSVLSGKKLTIKLKLKKAGSTRLKIKVKNKTLSIPIKIKSKNSNSTQNAVTTKAEATSKNPGYDSSTTKANATSETTSEDSKTTELATTTENNDANKKASADATTEASTSKNKASSDAGNKASSDAKKKDATTEEATTTEATTTEKATTTERATTTEKATTTERVTTTEASTTAQITTTESTTAAVATTESATLISINTFAKRVVNAFANGESSVSFTGTFSDSYNDSWTQDIYEELGYVGVTGNYGLTGSYIKSNGNSYGSINFITGYSYVGSKYTYTYTVSWSEEVAAKETALNSELTSIISSLNLNSKSDIEKIKAVHDYVVNRLTYDQNNAGISHTAYGAVDNNTAVCQGYSLLTMRLLNMIGIDTTYVHSNNHSWNLVKYNGVYYNLDATWDDPTSNMGPVLRYTYFMKSNADLTTIDQNNGHVRKNDCNTSRFITTYPVSNTSLVHNYS